MTTITHATGTIIPSIVDGYTAAREARTVVHPILNRTDPDITFRPAGPRAGTLRCVFGTEIDAREAFGILSDPQVFALEDDDTPTVNMSFVVALGDLEVALDDETRAAWVVSVPFVEVSP